MSRQYPLPKHPPLLITLTERRNADSENYLGTYLSEAKKLEDCQLGRTNLAQPRTSGA